MMLNLLSFVLLASAAPWFRAAPDPSATPAPSPSGLPVMKTTSGSPETAPEEKQEWKSPRAPLSKKGASRIVTKEMRKNAVRNVERYPWAKTRQEILLGRLEPYLEVPDDFLWHVLPSQGMPRSSRMEQNDAAPPGAEESHFSKGLIASRGLGFKNHFHIDPFNHPWKVQSRGSGIWYPDNDFAAYYQSGLDEHGNFHLGAGDPRFLKAVKSDDGPPLIDDGTGVEFEGRTYFFAAQYAFKIWTEMIDVVRDFAELYTLTNNPLYAHKAGVLLDRMADLYPEMDYGPWYDLGMEASTGGEGLGRVQGKIWETFSARILATAYDQIFDALLEDEALQAFAEAKSRDYKLGDKSSPRQIAGHIEQNLLREFLIGIADKRIGGNPGMAQVAQAASAVALDNGEETKKHLDWLFEPEGGMMPGILLDGLSRDGYGHESGLGYATLPTKTSFETARLLMAYPDYSRSDLFEEFPKFKNALSAGQRVKVSKGSILHWGDGGRAMSIGETGYPMTMDMALMGWRLGGGEDSLREIYDQAIGDPARIPGDIYAAEPEEERAEILAALEKLGPARPESYNSGGIGFAVLQAPSLKNPRMVALNYGPMGWGHGQGDRLSLHLIDHDAYMATDLGYPTLTGPYPPRIGWSAHTVSHNTVMVDDTLINRDSVFSGKARLFAEAGPLRVMDIDSAGPRVMRGRGHSAKSSAAHPLYPGVSTYRRCVVMVDVDEDNSYYVDLFWVRGGRKHTLIQNGGGHEVASSWRKWKKQAKGTAAGEEIAYGEFFDGPQTWDYQGSGLMFLQNVERAQPDRPFWIEWKIAEPFNQSKDLRFRVHNLSAINEAILADGETPSRGPILRYLLRNVEGENLATQFVSVLEPYQDSPNIASCRVLGTSSGEAEEFAVALELRLADGRRDLLMVTEGGGTFKTGALEIDGRVAWVRFAANGAVRENALVAATKLEVQGRSVTMHPATFEGRLEAIDDSDADNVRVQTGLKDLPAAVVGRYLIVANRQRADASYPIKAVEDGGWINIGRAALGELHIDPSDYAKGTLRNIEVGDAFAIANIHHDGP